MIIDIHTHTFPDRIAARTVQQLAAAANSPANTDGTEANLLSSMDLAGIDISVIMPVATRPGQAPGINQKVYTVHERNERLYSFGAIHPADENWEEILRELHAAEIKGIKVHPVYQGVALDDIRFLRIFDYCMSHDMAVLTHAGYDISCNGDNQYCASPEHVIPMLKTLKPDKMILAHMGGWEDWDKMDALMDAGFFYVDTAFSVQPLRDPGPYPRLMKPERFKALVRQLGADRVIFGSDSPWEDQKDLLDQILQIGFTDEELQKLLCDNAKQFL